MYGEIKGKGLWVEWKNRVCSGFLHHITYDTLRFLFPYEVQSLHTGHHFSLSCKVFSQTIIFLSLSCNTFSASATLSITTFPPKFINTSSWRKDSWFIQLIFFSLGFLSLRMDLTPNPTQCGWERDMINQMLIPSGHKSSET